MKTVLFADDHLEFRAIHAAYLEQHGYRVLSVADGESAVTQTRAQLPDLVVTDYSMPGLNGLGVVEQIKGDPATKHIPVIVLTAQSYGAVGNQVRAFGCAGFLSKPLGPERVLQEVRTHIGV